VGSGVGDGLGVRVGKAGVNEGDIVDLLVAISEGAGVIGD